jgi:hypothetical protein
MLHTKGPMLPLPAALSLRFEQNPPRQTPLYTAAGRDARPPLPGKARTGERTGS